MNTITLLILLYYSYYLVEVRTTTSFDNNDHPFNDKILDKWAETFSKQLFALERSIINSTHYRQSSVTRMMMSLQNITDLTNEIHDTISDLLEKRESAAVKIALTVESNALNTQEAPEPITNNYNYFDSYGLDSTKPLDEERDQNASCISKSIPDLYPSKHFAHEHITLQHSSVHVAAEVYSCQPEILRQLYDTELLNAAFRENYSKDSSISWQYYCSARGFMRHYPAAVWKDVLGAGWTNEVDVFDCRMRDWYVEATGAPRDIVVLLDATGSMTGQKVGAAQRILEILLLSLTSDDHFNVFHVSDQFMPVVPCFGLDLVPAVHANVITVLRNALNIKVENQSRLDYGFRNATYILKHHKRDMTGGAAACQQAIVVIADDMPEDWRQIVKVLNDKLKARIFIFLIGSSEAVTSHLAKSIACENDGYFALMSSESEATEQAMKMLRVFERPIVLQQIQRPIVWSGQFAHVQDVRASYERWHQIQNAEQKRRYKLLRQDKIKLLSSNYSDTYYRRLQYETELGHYPENNPEQYQLQLSVAVPVVDPTEYENETIRFMEELQRNVTVTRRVARLLGVAGVDLPLRHLQQHLPYHKLGHGGSIFIIDHRGQVVMHEDHRPVIHGHILKPNYRSVDLLDVEMYDDLRKPRDYSPELLQFRRDLVMKENGTRFLQSLHPFDNRLRAVSERRVYSWRRIRNTGYTVVVSLPASVLLVQTSGDKRNSRDASAAHHALQHTMFTLHPDWTYCRHIERYFATREQEFLHFLNRISEEENFKPKKLRRTISPLEEGLIDKPYICNMDLVEKTIYDAISTAWFTRADAHGEPIDQRLKSEFAMGSATAFIATSTGLTRWYNRDTDRNKPFGVIYPRGPNEPYYRRAALTNGKTLVLQAHDGWITAARYIPSQQAVAGYYIKESRMLELLINITESTGHCLKEDWLCMVVDDAGWVIVGADDGSGHFKSGEHHDTHLATVHPRTMRLLLDAEIYRRRSFIDYQAVCFRHVGNGALRTIHNLFGGLVESVWKLIFETVVSLIGFGSSGRISKRPRKQTPKDDFDKLYDPRVRVNRSILEACDRVMPLYELMGDEPAQAQLRRPVELTECRWPLAARRLPGIDALLLAVYLPCPETDTPVESFDRVEWRGNLSDTESPACLVHRNKLPARGTPSPCFKHHYEMEGEFRVCNETLVPDTQ